MTMKTLTRHLAAWLCLFMCSGSITVAQEKPEDSWLNRATTITDDLVKDAVSLAPNERALLWARIGKAWEKDNLDRAAAGYLKAVEIVEVITANESVTEREQRLDTARTLLGIIPPQYDKLTLRLNELRKPPDARKSENGEPQNGEALIDSAMMMVDTKPQAAFDLAVASLRFGTSRKLAGLLWKLRKSDSALADQLFDDVLAAARVTFDAESLSWLAVYAFNGKTSSIERRKLLLGVVAQGILRNPVSVAGRAEVCKLAPTAATYLEQLNQLLPLQSIMVRQALFGCQQSLEPSARQSVEQALRDQPLKTSADFESEADKSSDQQSRDEHLTRAARLAAEEKNYEHAVLLLDRISDEGRKQLEGGWESWRWTYAAFAALAQLKRGDQVAMYRLIAATPATLRALVQIRVAQELGKTGEASSAIVLLNEARRWLSQSTTPETVDGCFSLLRQYEKINPVDAMNVFNEAVKALNRVNRAEKPGHQSNPPMSLLQDEIPLGVYNVPATLLERDEPGVRAAISSIESPSQRAALRLNLLRFSLARLRSAPPQTKPAISKTVHRSED